MIYLASQSPRRQALLQQIAVEYKTVSVDIDETPLVNEPAEDYVKRLALAKAQAGVQQLTAQSINAPVLGADTTVVLDGQLLGKPSNQTEGLQMLRALSGRGHNVLTAVALCDAQYSEVALSCSEVRFRQLTEKERMDYWATGEPCDKAGAYAIQGQAALFIEHLSGSYSGVMGLPLFETGQLLSAYKASDCNTFAVETT